MENNLFVILFYVFGTIPLGVYLASRTAEIPAVKDWIEKGVKELGPSKSLDYWTQQEIDQTMAWWDREFNRLSGTAKQDLPWFKEGDHYNHDVDYVTTLSGKGDLAVCITCAKTYRYRRGVEPVYALTHMHAGEYVLDVIPPTKAELHDPAPRIKDFALPSTEDQAYELPVPIAIPYRASRNIYAMTQERGRL